MVDFNPIPVRESDFVVSNKAIVAQKSSFIDFSVAAVADRNLSIGLIREINVRTVSTRINAEQAFAVVQLDAGKTGIAQPQQVKYLIK